MNLFDIIILTVLALFALKGVSRGLVNEVSSLAGLILGAWLAYRFYPSLSSPISTVTHLPAGISSFLAFMLILVLTGVASHIVGNIVTGALKLAMLSSVNRVGGLLIGAIEGAILLCLVFSTATAGFMPEQLKQKIRSSESANLCASAGDSLLTLWRGTSATKP